MPDTREQHERPPPPTLEYAPHSHAKSRLVRWTVPFGLVLVCASVGALVGEFARPGRYASNAFIGVYLPMPANLGETASSIELRRAMEKVIAEANEATFRPSRVEVRAVPDSRLILVRGSAYNPEAARARVQKFVDQLIAMQSSTGAELRLESRAILPGIPKRPDLAHYIGFFLGLLAGKFIAKRTVKPPA